MKKSVGLVIAGLACAAVMAGGTAFAAVSSIPDSQGVIHGCYSANGAGGTNGTPLNIVDSSQAGCSKGQTAIIWNQTGPQGPQGSQGPTGPAGPGYTFAYSYSVGPDGPSLTKPAEYFIAVEVTLYQQVTSTTMGTCTILDQNSPFGGVRIDGSFVLPPFFRAQYTFSGIVNGSYASSTSPIALSLTCQDADTGTAVTPLIIQWWVSPVAVQ